MAHHASQQKSKTNDLKSPARVVSIFSAGKKKSKNHEPIGGKKSKDEFPLFNNERIFKPKEHDPL